MGIKNIIEKSYAAHRSGWGKYVSGESYLHWAREDTIDAWRHKRMYRTLLPLIRSCPGAEWLTVGDGRYGSDAHFLKQEGCSALATDIGTELLEPAKERGFIDAYRKENAEALSFSDQQFTFVLCKESFHHFPRPMIALYEMLRVAGLGVVLIEPNDQDAYYRLPSHFLRRMREKIRSRKCAKGTSSAPPSFEPVGNYMYAISRRELEKCATALDCYALAFKGLNDAYLEGASSAPASFRSLLFVKIRAKIFLRNVLVKLGIVDYGLLSAVIFKSDPGGDCVQSLLADGFNVVYLPRNPYLAGQD